MAPPARTENRFFRSVLAALGIVGLMALAGTAGAASFSSLTIAKNAANSAFRLTQTANSMRTRDSSVSVVSSGANAFATRYAMVVGADVGNAATVTENMTASYTITFQVTAPVGEAWVVNLVTSRVGALTLVSDGANGSARDTLSAVTGTKAGAGTLTGSLALAVVPTITSGNTTNTPFNQTSSAAITGVGTGAAQLVTLAFNWTASARSTRQVNNGDEAAVRMGLTSAATGFTADDYPGIGRTITGDGHFVSATLIPEPTPVALLLPGLTGLAFAGTRRH